MSYRDITIRITEDGADETINKIKELGGSIEGAKRSVQSTDFETIKFGKTLTGVVARGIVAWDRFEIAATAVENAQIRQTIAQDRLRYMTDRHGASSREAVQAQRELEIATRGVDIATQRQAVRMAFAALVVVPDMIRGIGKLNEFLKTSNVLTSINTALTQAQTRARLAAVAATVIGIPLAIAGVAAASAFDVGTVGGGQSVNVYGDVNVQTPDAQRFPGQLNQQVNRSAR
mgnify:CR=1 FL=1